MASSPVSARSASSAPRARGRSLHLHLHLLRTSTGLLSLSLVQRPPRRPAANADSLAYWAMEQPPIDDAAGANGPVDGGGQPVSGAPGPPDGSDAHGLATEAEEIRRLVDAGTDSPEALRDLAARLREHRAREDSLWRAEVKPALVKENKGRLRGFRTATPPVLAEPKTSNAPAYAAMLVGMLIIVVVAANTTVWVLLIPLLGLLGFAWKQGRATTKRGDPGPTR